jgi:hypothetical protein
MMKDKFSREILVEHRAVVERLTPIADSIFKEEAPIQEASLEWRKIFECVEYVEYSESSKLKPGYYGLKTLAFEEDPIDQFGKRVKALIKSLLMSEETQAVRVIENSFTELSTQFNNKCFEYPRPLGQLSFDNGLEKVSLLKRKPVALIVNSIDYLEATKLSNVNVEIILNRYLKTGAWFIKTDEKDGLQYCEKEPLTWFFASNGKYIELKAHKCAAWGASDSRCLVGSYDPEE